MTAKNINETRNNVTENITKRKLKISAVIVNFNSGLYLKECIEGILQHLEVKDDGDEIIVVDNNSTDNSLASIESLSPIKIIPLKTNLGYGGGCNVGFDHSSGRILFFLNPDVKLISTVNYVLDLFEKNANCAIVAPGIIEQGHLCNSLRPFPSVLKDALGEFGLSLKQGSIGVSWETLRVENNQKEVQFWGYTQGSAFFLRREVFEQAGKFDPGFFLYYEEVDLFKRIADREESFFYEPKCLVIHVSGGSSSGLEWRKTAIRYNSKKRYFTKHASKPWLIIHKILILLILFLKLLSYYPIGIILRRDRKNMFRAYLYAMLLYAGRSCHWKGY